MRLNRHKLGITTLILGAVALGCAIIPSIVMDEPVRPFWAQKQAVASDPRNKEKSDSTFSVRIKNFDFSWRKKTPPASQPENAPAVPSVEEVKPPPIDWVRRFTAISIALAIGGIVVAPFAYIRERPRPIAVTGAIACVVALTWQYIFLGLMIGVALAILIFLLGNLG